MVFDCEKNKEFYWWFCPDSIRSNRINLLISTTSWLTLIPMAWYSNTDYDTILFFIAVSMSKNVQLFDVLFSFIHAIYASEHVVATISDVCHWIYAKHVNIKKKCSWFIIVMSRHPVCRENLSFVRQGDWLTLYVYWFVGTTEYKFKNFYFFFLI